MRKLIIVALTAVLAVPAFAEEVELVTGEKLSGTVSGRSQAGLWLEHPVLGKLWISGENVAGVDGGPLVDPMAAAVSDLESAAADAEDGTPAEPEVDPAHAWKFSIGFGATGKSGNGDSNDLNAQFEAKQEDESKRWLGRAEYVYSDADDDNGDNQKTKDKAQVTLVRDFLMPDSPWFFFGAGKHEWDEFTPWTRRLSLQAGAGRELVKNDEWEVRARAGFGYTKEDGSDNDDWREEGMIGAEASWKINEWQSIEANSFYFPDFDDAGEYRITSRLDWAIRLNEAASLHLKLGVKNEYDSHRTNTPTQKFDRNELEYYVALSYSF